jgi:adenylate cyclase
MNEFLAQLKRRHIYRVAAAYAVVAWVLIQLVDNVAPALRLPEWTPALVIVLLFVGLPITLLSAWTRELAPADGARPATGTLDWALMAALVTMIALVSYQQLAPTTGASTAQQGSLAPAAPQTLSIAVLPFTNMSGDAAQEFFSDGMTEEITTALAKVPDLHVVGRTSAFQFKGQNKDLTAIGQALHATHLIEGSVRKDGNEIRITAQLIRAGDGTHLWTESYNRELKGVFAVQEEIAQAIAAALQVPLGLKQGEVLVSNRTSDTDSYQDYLRARALVRARILPNAIAILEPAIARDPGYAPAWAMLAQAYDLTPNQYSIQFNDYGEGLRRIADASLPRAEMAARRAIQLDANLADGYVALARLEDRRGKILLAEELYSKALALDPNNPEALHAYSAQLAAMGRVKEAVAIRQRLQGLEPFVPVFNFNTALILWLDGQDENASAMAKALSPPLRQTVLSAIDAAVGRYSEAADMLLEMVSGNRAAGELQDATRLLRTAPAIAASPQTLPRLGLWDFVYIYVGAPSRFLESREGQLEAGYLVPISNALLWHSSYTPVRKTERFKAYARKAGMVDYWRARDWPDLCRPMGADDFECD